MSIFRKIAATALALFMGGSVFALSACGDGGGLDVVFPPISGGDTDKEPDPSLPEEKGDKEAFFASLAAQSADKASFETEIGYSETKYVYSGASSVGKKVVSSETDDVFARGFADFKSGDIDLSVTDDKTEVVDGVSASDSYVGYYFRRGEHEFSSLEEGTSITTDYTRLTLTYGGDMLLNKDIVGILGYVPKIINDIPSNFLLAKLADAVGALQVGKESAAIDVNLLLYTVATDFKTVVAAVDANTTVGAILSDETVKKYLTVFTELVSVEKVADFVSRLPYLTVALKNASDDKLAEYGLTRETADKIIARIDGVDFSALAKIAPDEKSTTYDYLIKLLKSSELKDVVNAMFFSDAEDGEKLPKISDIKLSYILSLAGIKDSEVAEKLAAFKNYTAAFISDSFTKTAFKYTKKAAADSISPTAEGADNETESCYGTESYTLSDAVITYDLTESGAAGVQHISFLGLMRRSGTVGGETVLSEASLAVDFKVDFAPAETLKDIGNCTVRYKAASVIGASEKTEIDRAALDGGEGIAPVVLRTLTDFGGNLTGVDVYDNEGIRLSGDGEFSLVFDDDEGGKKQFEFSYTFSQFEESGDVKVNIICGGTTVKSVIIWSKEYTFTGKVSEIVQAA